MDLIRLLERCFIVFSKDSEKGDKEMLTFYMYDGIYDHLVILLLRVISS